MLELVDGIVATGESAFRPGRATTSEDVEWAIDPILLAESESQWRSSLASTPIASDHEDASKDELQKVTELSSYGDIVLTAGPANPQHCERQAQAQTKRRGKQR